MDALKAFYALDYRIVFFTVTIVQNAVLFLHQKYCFCIAIKWSHDTVYRALLVREKRAGGKH